MISVFELKEAVHRQGNRYQGAGGSYWAAGSTSEGLPRPVSVQWQWPLQRPQAPTEILPRQGIQHKIAHTRCHRHFQIQFRNLRRDTETLEIILQDVGHPFPLDDVAVSDATKIPQPFGWGIVVESPDI